MSEQEQNLLRLASWDNYCAAKREYQAQKAKLHEWGKLFSQLGKGLLDNPVFVAENVFASAPTHEQFVAAIQEFRQAIHELKRTWLAARDFNFPVEQGIDKEIGPF